MFYICDRFFLGGPHTVRGFELRGLGPQQDGQALGATGYWAAALHLFAPLPFRPGRGGLGDILRTHFFVNAGNIDDFNFGKELRRICQLFKRSFTDWSRKDALSLYYDISLIISLINLLD